MLTRCRIRTSEPPRQGFSLIETAIVLAVFGTIVAGVFNLIAPTLLQGKVNQASDDLSTIVGNVRALYSGNWTPTTPAVTDCPATFSSTYLAPGATWTTAQFKSSGIFPSGILNTTGGKTYANNIVGGASKTQTAMADLCYMRLPNSSFTAFAVRYSKLSVKACLALAMKTSSLAFGTNLYQIVITNASSVATTFVTQIGNTGTGVNPTTGVIILPNALTACTGGTDGGAIVDWYYKLNN